MVIKQKFQTIKGVVTIKRVYKNLEDSFVEVISETFVDAPFNDKHILDKLHGWAASVRSENRLQRPPEQILALIGRSWQEIVGED